MTRKPIIYLTVAALLCKQFPVTAYASGTVLSCTKTEHTHSDSCYTEKSVKTCKYTVDADHVHGDSCYDEEGNKTCNTVHPDQHTHADSCYTMKSTLTCSLAEHTHSDSCYTAAPSAPGGSEGSGDSSDGSSGTSGDSGETTETNDEETTDSSDESKSDEENEEESSEKKEDEEDEEEDNEEEEEEDEEDNEDEEEENEDDEDYSSYVPRGNPKADVESSYIWEKTMADVVLTGDWAHDLIAIAESQLGYKESTRNYVVTKKGKKKGYTRYGAWYGNKYGDWCAMFISFCLNYAKIDADLVPRASGCDNWLHTFDRMGMYQKASTGYLPKPGDLIFFNWDKEPDSDHVGIVTEAVTEEDGSITIHTIEGNSSNQVKRCTYESDSPKIMGYAILPENPHPEIAPEEIEAVSEEPTSASPEVPAPASIADTSDEMTASESISEEASVTSILGVLFPALSRMGRKESTAFGLIFAVQLPIILLKLLKKRLFKR